MLGRISTLSKYSDHDAAYNHLMTPWRIKRFFGLWFHAFGRGIGLSYVWRAHPCKPKIVGFAAGVMIPCMKAPPHAIHLEQQ